MSKNNEPVDGLIVKEILLRNEAGIERLLEEYGSFIKSVVVRYLGHLASYQEECIDDVLLAIWNHMGEFDQAKGNLRNWIAGICRFKAVSCQRKHYAAWQELAYSESLQDMENTPAPPPTAEEMEQELSMQMEEMLSHLSKKEQKILKDLYLKELPAEAVAKENQISRDAVYKCSQRAKTKLKNLFCHAPDGAK